MRAGHRRAAPLAALAALMLAGCTPALPESVVPGTEITVGWNGELTSTNAAATPTPGNIDVAEAIRGDFGDVIEGEFVPDEGFGTVMIVSDDPFTVRYDLAEPVWSDGIPLDAADLLLGWADTVGLLPAEAGEDGAADDAVAEDAADPPAPPKIDEFARTIDATWPTPRMDWQTAVKASVPAHVVGARAFGIDDAMEAKQAVIDAIQDEDAAALAEIAEVWNAGFELEDGAQAPAELLLSSGPFQIDDITTDEDGQGVTLVPNTSYRGLVTAKVARIDLVPGGDDPLADIGDRLDVVQLRPTAANREPVRELERVDFTVNTSHDGTVWSVQLNPAGVFGGAPARAAFLRALPASALVERGGGEWASAYTASTSMVSAPGSRAYDIVAEDSGFTAALGTPADDAAVDRESAGVAAGSRVCVLYDRSSEFAVGAFAALRDAAAEAGWGVTDCGSDDYQAALEQRSWNAVIARVPIPQSAAQIADQWGTEGTASLTRNADADRDALIAQLSQTTDVYEAREVRAQIEATIVRAAVALPIAANQQLTVIDRGVTGVSTRNGADASLTSGMTQWEVVP
ncbi:hypothetical protein LG322_02145 [Microbacterium aerolatum]|uniref:hypothetical protein n=1 Tax=Microbacterium aerolatum TaxID=153731 RepID=UPI003850E281